MNKSELQLLIEMMKRETEVALRTHFDIFRQEIRGEVAKKIEGKEVK